MNTSELFETENGIYFFDGAAILSGPISPNFEFENGSVFLKSTGEVFKRINDSWIQIESKQAKLIQSEIFDDVIPENGTALFSSPELIGELEIAGEVLIL